jgi:sporulation integral membrane protein YlbJ
MAASLILFPKESFDASIRGLNMWWEVVFPSLLPFFIVSEMLIGFGVVRFLGVLLEPLMRPVFRVPGVGGFVWAMGMASGYPAGAKLTARLRQEKQITAIEAERLVSFTNSSNPLFIFGAIAVGFFHNPQLGIILALSHYLGNLCVGLIMRFHGTTLEKGRKKEENNRFSLKVAFQALHQTRIKDNRPIGMLLGDAVTSSIQTLLMIGGFIILFSVVNRVLSLIQITPIFASIVAFIFSILHIPEQLSTPFISGLFEITLGSKLASGVEGVSLLHQVMITSFVLAFSGFSVQAQVASIIAETDIRFKPFFIARIFHGFFAATFTFLLWQPLYTQMKAGIFNGKAIPVFKIGIERGWSELYWSLLLKYGALFTIGSLGIYSCILFYRIHFSKYR